MANCRAIIIPPDLDAEQRARFVAKISAAVRQQAELAKRCPGVLRVTREVGEERGRLLIPHEPATAAEPRAVIGAEERPDINALWWLTVPLVQAWQVAAAAKAIHGGVQLGAVYLDEAGRPKLGDFGIAKVFEDVCGVAVRARVCWEAGGAEEGGLTLSGQWSLLREDETREFGWIASYFAHELLERQVPLNLKSDQFALGVVLFALASGGHPYGAAWSDPTLNLYFQIEPYLLAEERSDWAKAFQRQRTDVATKSDQAVLAWSELVGRLLASEPERRFGLPEEAETLWRAHLPPVWVEAAEAIAAATDLLEEGEAGAFLSHMLPWCTHEALPELCRARLTAWAERVDAQKESLRARKLREHRLAAAREAVELYDLAAAREGATAIVDDAEAEDDLRRAAAELLETCDKQQRFIESGADAVASAYLEAAHESLERGELDDARQVLQGIMQDPGMSPPRAAQARQLIGEVELAAQRLDRQSGELAAADKDARRRDYVVAEQRLEALLAEQELAEAVAGKARALLEDVRTRQRQRAEWQVLLNEAQGAWERADRPAMQARLDKVPADCGEPDIEAQRRQLVEAAGRLAGALEQKAQAERLLAEEQASEAAAAADRAAAIGDLPATLATALAELAAHCTQVLAERRAAALARARSALTKAGESYERGALADCRRLLEESVLAVAELPADLRAAAQRTLESCARATQAAQELDRAQQELAGNDFATAAQRVTGVAVAGLPESLVERARKLGEEIATGREQFVRRQVEGLGRRLDTARAAIEAGRGRAARAALREVERSRYVTAELRERSAQLRALMAARRKPLKVRPFAAGGLAVVVCVVIVWFLVRGGAEEEVQAPPSAVTASAEVEPQPEVVVEPEVTEEQATEPEVAEAQPSEAEVTETPTTEPAEEEVVETTEPRPTSPEVVEAAEPEPEEPPVPTFAEAAETFVSALRSALPEGITEPSLSGEPPAALVVEAAWDGHELLPYRGLEFDAQRGAFVEAPELVAGWFRRQIEALGMLAAAEGVTFELDERYDAVLGSAGALEARVAAVDETTVVLDAVVPLRLRGDPRPDASFACSGRLVGATLSADEAGRAAFAAYLRELQRERAAAAAARLADAPKLPGGVRLVLPDEFDGGDAVSFAVRYGDGVLATLPARWDPSALTYVAERAAFGADVRAGLKRMAESEPIQRALRSGWPAVAEALAVAAGRPGADYYRQCGLLELTVLSEPLGEPFELPVRVRIGREGASAEERIDVELWVGFVDGALSWDTTRLDAARRSVAEALDGLARSETLRRRRQSRAVTELAAELGVSADTVGAQRDGDSLTAEVVRDGRTTRYVWRWDPLGLRYTDRQELAPPSVVEQPEPPPLSVADRLAWLAESPTVPADEFVVVWREVLARKVASYGADAYRVAPGLATGDPAGALLASSRTLQALIAPDPAADPFPVVFVEYYVGPQDVYALAWRVETDPQDRIVAAADPQVWHVMGTAALEEAADPSAFRQRYSSDAELGERLLGRALSAPGEPVRASANRSFGLVVAPQERLWLVRWEQVRFRPRRISGLAGRGAPDPGEFTDLRQVLQPHESRREGPQWRRAGIWCVPALGGAWQGDSADIRLTLGALVPGKPAVGLRFRAYAGGELLFAYVEDPTLSGDFAWRNYVREVRRGEIGYTFWDRGWGPAGWRPTPYTSFSLIRMGSE